MVCYFVFNTVYMYTVSTLAPPKPDMGVSAPTIVGMDCGDDYDMSTETPIWVVVKAVIVSNNACRGLMPSKNALIRRPSDRKCKVFGWVPPRLLWKSVKGLYLHIGKIQLIVNLSLTTTLGINDLEGWAVGRMHSTHTEGVRSALLCRECFRDITS